MSWREELRGLVENASTDILPDLVGELARAQALVTARLLTPDPTANGRKTPPQIGQYLTADELAAKLKVKPKWCYEHSDELGAAKLSNGCVRFPARAVMRFIQARVK
jgi:hypothetical protein